MKRYFSGMTAQQAPIPWAARQAAVSLPGTLHTALRMPHWTRLRSAFASTAPRINVVIVEPIDPNRLARIQRVTGFAYQPERTRVVGRGLLGTSVSVVIALALRQRDARIVPVHEQADAERDGEEHQHDQRDRLDR